MSIRSLLEGRSKKNADRRNRKRGSARRRNRQLRHEALEDRRLLSLSPTWGFALESLDVDHLDNPGSPCLATDSEANVYVFGDFRGTVDFDPGPGLSTLTARTSDDPNLVKDDIFLAKYADDGSLLWVHQIGGPQYEQARSIALDGQGHIYLAGICGDNAYLDNSSTPILESTVSESEDALFAKFDTDGNFIWARGLGGTSTAYGEDIAVAADGTVYTAGYMWGDGAFYGGGTTIPVSASVSDGFTAFILAVNADGDFVDVWGPDGEAEAYEIAVDGSSVFLTGMFQGAVDFNPRGDADIRTIASNDTSTYFNGFIAEYSTGGVLNWVQTIQGSRIDMRGLALDGDAAYVSGIAENTSSTDFSSGAGTVTLGEYGGGWDGFIAKYSRVPGEQQGDAIWARSISCTGSDALYEIAVDDLGIVYTAGRFSEQADFDPGPGVDDVSSDDDGSPGDGFLWMLDSSGEYVRAIQITGGGRSTLRSVVLGSDPNQDAIVYMAGWSDRTVNLPTGDVLVSSGAGWDEGFLMKLDLDRPIIRGDLFADLNGNGIDDDGVGVPGTWNVSLYRDADGDGQPDSAVPYRTTSTFGANSNFTFQNLEQGNYVVTQDMQPGWTQTAPVDALGNPISHAVTVAAGETAIIDFGNATDAEVSIYSQATRKNLRDGGWVTSTLDVADTHNILDLNVTIDISHANVEDLSATLISPAGTQVPLFYRVGGTGDNFTATVFDDQATTPISAGTVPFTGRFLPDLPLGILAEESVNGTWGLQVRDHTKGMRGTLNFWSLEVTHLAEGPVNSPPVATDDADATDEDTPVTIDKAVLLSNDTDPENDTLSITGFGTPGNGTLVENGDGTTVTYTPDPDFYGDDTFTYTISDGNGGTDTAIVTVTVDPVNDAPVAVDDFFTTTVDTPFTGNVLTNDSDVDGDAFFAELGASPTDGIVALAPDGSFTYTPNAGSTGTDTFTYVARDDHEAYSNPATVTITVADPVDPPQISITDVSKEEGRFPKTTTFTFTVTRSGDTSGITTINYATNDGTATLADNDYVSNSGTLTFAAGETTKMITVTVIGDKTNEPTETFQLLLTDEFGNEIAVGTGTIIDDDK